MKIVLLADNSRNELLANFCTAYSTILSKHQLISVYNTAKFLRATVNLEISGLSVDYSSGIEQLASRARFNELDCIIYLRDGKKMTYNSSDELLNVCDYNNIPYATNLATAETLILAIDRGDLDWREWVKNA